jgi:hypothetical protein
MARRRDVDSEAIKLLGEGGLAAALLLLIYIVGNRMVAAIDRIGVKVDEHTKVDTSYHAAVREELADQHGIVMARLEGMEVRIDTALDLTPVRATSRPKTNPRGVPVGYRSPRPGTHSDGED